MKILEKVKPRSDNDFFDIAIGVLQGDMLARYSFMFSLY